MKIVLYIALFQTLVALFFVFTAKQRDVFLTLIKLLILIPLIQLTTEILFFEFQLGSALQWDFMFPTNLLVPVLIFYMYRNAKPPHKQSRTDKLHLVPFFLFLAYGSLAILEYIHTGDATVIRTYTGFLFPLIVLSFIAYPLYVLLRLRPLEFTENTLPELKVDLLNKVAVLVILTGLMVGFFFWQKRLVAVNIVGYIYLTLLYLLVVNFLYKRRRLINKINKEEGEKYSRSSLNDAELKAILKKLDNFMEKEKPYLDGDLKLEDLSSGIAIPKHHITQALNIKRDKNFNTYVNDYRVREFIKLCKIHPNYKLELLFIKCGFSSKSTFNRAFKNRKGITPSQYLSKARMD